MPVMLSRLWDVFQDIVLGRQRCPHCWERHPEQTLHAHITINHAGD